MNGRRWALPGSSPRLPVKAGHGSVGWSGRRKRWRLGRLQGCSLEQPIRIRYRDPRWRMDLRNHAEFVLFLLLFSSSSFFFPSELTLSSVSHCDSPIFESHCVQPTQECQSVSFALTSALAISSRLTIQWKRNDDVFDRNAGMFLQTRRGLD